MTGPHTGIADAALASVRGTTAAQRLVHLIRQGHAPSDALHCALQAELVLGDQHRLEGFARELQKTIERVVAP